MKLRHQATRLATTEDIPASEAMTKLLIEENNILKRENASMREMLMQDAKYVEYVGLIRQLRLSLRVVLDNRDAWRAYALQHLPDRKDYPPYGPMAAEKARVLVEAAYNIDNSPTQNENPAD